MNERKGERGEGKKSGREWRRGGTTLGLPFALYSVSF